MEKYFGGRVRDIDYNNQVIACLDKIQKQGAYLTSEEREKLFKAALENRKKSVQAAATTSGLFPVYLFELGKMYIQAGEFKEAVEKLSIVRQYFPENRDVQMLLDLAKQQMTKTR